MILSSLMPDFIGIGAMRSGTSWLAAHLERHPDIWMKGKELHFFNRKVDRRRPWLLSAETAARLDYGSRFAWGKARGKVAGEITPAYAILPPDRIRLVRSWAPEARLLYIMREPVERAWSQARRDFPRWWGKSVIHADEGELRAYFEESEVRRRGEYASCLTSWLQAYPRERVWIGFLDDVRRDPVAVLRDVFGFLGVDAAIHLYEGDVSAPVHAAESVPMPEAIRAYLQATFATQADELEAIVGRPVPWGRG